jgi:hypothetical protein
MHALIAYIFLLHAMKYIKGIGSLPSGKPLTNEALKEELLVLVSKYTCRSDAKTELRQCCNDVTTVLVRVPPRK